MGNDVLKVAIIEPVGGHGGMDYYDFGLAAGLADAGINVVLHTCDETDIPSEDVFEVRHTFNNIYGKFSPWKRGIRYFQGSIMALLSAVSEEREIVHFHFFHVSILQIMQVLLARLFMRKVVITAHDVESFVEGLEVPTLSHMAYRLAHRVIAHNQISKTELIERIGLNTEKIAVIPHGNYLHAIHALPSQAQARRRMNIAEQCKVILFFGQIKEVKGLNLLIAAMPEVLKKHPETVLLIAGKPWKSDFSVYQELIDKVGIRDHCITHIRFIPDDDVPFYYGACDLVVLPYRRIYQSGVVLMAMSYGKAVLVSDLPGMLEVVQDQETGFVFHSDNIVDLALKICNIFTNLPIIESVSKHGYNLMKVKYDWAVIGKKTKDIYASLQY